MNITTKAEEVMTALGDRKDLDSKKDDILLNIVQKLTDKRRALGDNFVDRTIVAPSTKRAVEKKAGKK